MNPDRQSAIHQNHLTIWQSGVGKHQNVNLAKQGNSDVNFEFLYSLKNRMSILVRQERVDLRFGTTKFPNAYNFDTLPSFTIQLNRNIGTLKEEEFQSISRLPKPLLLSAESIKMADIEEKTF